MQKKRVRDGKPTELEGIAQVSEGIRRAHQGTEAGHRRLQTVVKLQPGKNHGSGTVRAKWPHKPIEAVQCVLEVGEILSIKTVAQHVRGDISQLDGQCKQGAKGRDQVPRKEYCGNFCVVTMHSTLGEHKYWCPKTLLHSSNKIKIGTRMSSDGEDRDERLRLEFHR